MAVRGLLHHPLRPPSCTANARYRLPRRFLSFSEVFPGGRRLSSSLKFLSVQCSRASPRAESDAYNDSDIEFVEWVNKASLSPIVEVDPITVFRRIIAERTASLARASATQKAGDADTVQSVASASFFISSRLPGKSVVAISVAVVLLALAAASYFLRSKSSKEKQTKSTLADGTTDFDGPNDERIKLVKDNIKAPESILTAMAIGAASVGRPKGQAGTASDTLHAANSGLVDTRWEESGAGPSSIVNKTGSIDTQIKGHQNPPFEQVSYNPNNLEAFGSFKTLNAGVDITEGPWFSQAANGPDDLQLESKIQSTPVVKKLEYGTVPTETQQLQLPTEAAVEQLVEFCYESPLLNNVVDGEFLGEVVAVSVAMEQVADVSHGKVECFKFEEPEDDDLSEDSNAIVEKLEQMMISQESMNELEGVDVAGGIDDSELEWPSNVEIDTTQMEVDDGASLVSSQNEVDYGVHVTGPLDEEPQMTVLQMGGSHSINPISHHNLGAIASGSPANSASESSEEDPRLECKQALEAAVPALAIGIGTVGTLFGVPGGLEVVGFVALASLLSQDFLWAESREKLWQELKGITDRQKLLNFLAKRNIVKDERDESSL